MGWMESIAACDDREAAREKFHDWCEMQADVHDAITFDGRQNDVARLHIETDGNYFARDLTSYYGPGACPVRVIKVDAVEEGVVELSVLLAELKMARPN